MSRVKQSKRMATPEEREAIRIAASDLMKGAEAMGFIQDLPTHIQTDGLLALGLLAAIQSMTAAVERWNERANAKLEEARQ